MQGYKYAGHHHGTPGESFLSAGDASLLGSFLAEMRLWKKFANLGHIFRVVMKYCNTC